MTITQQTKDALSNLHTRILDQLSTNPSIKCSLYGIDIYEDTRVDLISGGHSDVYTLVNDHSNATYLSLYDALAFVSYGWAAAVNNDSSDSIAPSEHPEKIRVRMINYIMSLDGHVVSCLELGIDKPNPEIQWEYDDQTSGLLKESFVLFYSHKDL